jgi:hypothetical protein
VERTGHQRRAAFERLSGPPFTKTLAAIAMSAAQLLAVVEVPHDDRVRCQAAGCNHSVFRRIHVVRENSFVKMVANPAVERDDLQATPAGYVAAAAQEGKWGRVHISS